jgi:hypothetical protein
MDDIVFFSGIILCSKVLSWSIVLSARGCFLSLNCRSLCFSGVSLRRWELEQEGEAGVRGKLREPARDMYATKRTCFFCAGPPSFLLCRFRCGPITSASVFRAWSQGNRADNETASQGPFGSASTAPSVQLRAVTNGGPHAGPNPPGTTGGRSPGYPKVTSCVIRAFFGRT